MLKDLLSRMKDVRDPGGKSETFNPLPVSTSPLDPTIAKLLLMPDMAGMLHAAKRYIIGECRVDNQSEASTLGTSVQGGNQSIFFSQFICQIITFTK